MMRLLSLSRRGGSLSCWYGRGEANVGLGSLPLGYGPRGGVWTRAAIACCGDYMLAKVWRDGEPEPGWQAEGVDPRGLRGPVGVGVWTSPRTPSTARALFDDLRLTPLTPDEFKRYGIRLGPRPALRVTAAAREAGVFRAPGRIGLSTGRAALAFDEETGEITNFVDLASGREFIAREPKRPLFGLTFTKPFQGERMTLTSRDFRSVKIEAAGKSLTVRFAAAPAGRAAAAVSARAADDGSFRLRLSVTPPPGWSLASARFPQTPAPAQLGEKAADDALLLPWSSGAVLPRPGAASQRRSADYPGSAFAQFVAYYDPTAGAYYALRDPGGHCKRLLLQCVAKQFVSVTFEHLFPETPKPRVDLPYEVELRTFRGDWRDAAAIYKRWARRQPWCARKLAQRDDVAAFLKEGAGVLIAGILNPAGRARLFGADMEKLPDLMDAYRSKTGLKHLVFVPYGWENRGTWAGINYLPARPSNEAWRKVNAELKRRGHRTMFLISGFWWVVKRRRTANGPAFDDTADFERRKNLCVFNADGTPWLVNAYDRTRQFGSWRGLSAKLCHGCPQACDTLKRTILDLARLGVAIVSFDQEIGGGQRTPCYNRSHPHPPGMGAWQWTGFRDLCAAARREGKPIQPELGFSLENVSELAIPYMATYWSRQFGEVNVAAAGGRGVGLFSYLYHEYVTAIGAACVQGQGARGTRPSPGLKRYIFANNLVRGLIPGPFLYEVPLHPRDKWRRAIAPAYFSYCRPYAHFPEYLLLGETVRPLRVRCRDVELYYWAHDRKHGKPRRKGGLPVSKRPLVLPAVATGSFRAADGSVAAFLVNTTEEPQEVAADLPEPRRVTVYRSDRTAAQPETAARRVRLTLEPLGVRVVVMK